MIYVTYCQEANDFIQNTLEIALSFGAIFIPPPPRAAGLSWPRRSVTVGLLRGVPGCYLLTVNSYVCENVSEPAFPLHGLPEHSLGINKAE